MTRFTAVAREARLPCGALITMALAAGIPRERAHGVRDHRVNALDPTVPSPPTFRSSCLAPSRAPCRPAAACPACPWCRRQLRRPRQRSARVGRTRPSSSPRNRGTWTGRRRVRGVLAVHLDLGGFHGLAAVTPGSPWMAVRVPAGSGRRRNDDDVGLKQPVQRATAGAALRASRVTGTGKKDVRRPAPGAAPDCAAAAAETEWPARRRRATADRHPPERPGAPAPSSPAAATRAGSAPVLPRTGSPFVADITELSGARPLRIDRAA